MKESYYNNYVREGNIYLYYNSFCDSYLIINEKLNDLFKRNLHSLDVVKKKNEKFYNNLEDNGFVVENNKDEKAEYMNLHLNARYLSNTYQIILNPTMDCDLECWYCYESHIKGSTMAESVIEKILNHIELKHKEINYKNLLISFFGGEPMMKSNNVIIPFLKNVESFTNKHEIKLNLSFTTNGTILNENLLDLLKNYSTSFQITLDGNKEIHDTVRYFKYSKKGSYNEIISNIIKINKELKDFHIRLRINYNSETLKNAYSIVDTLNFMNKSKITIALHKIWQEDGKEIDYSDIMKFIQYAQEKDFVVNYLPLELNSFTCYADLYNEIVFNYNGNVYKCTARDFETTEPEGKLLEDGHIIWNVNNIIDRMNVKLPKICNDCKLLPSCQGICSQKILEVGNNVTCILEKKLSIGDYIIYNFNRHSLRKKHLYN